MRLRRCGECDAEIYFCDAVNKWRHYDVIADHDARVQTREDLLRVWRVIHTEQHIKDAMGHYPDCRSTDDQPWCDCATWNVYDTACPICGDNA